MIGILLFIILYYIATTKYPGGSQININKEGFDWINNYWCNLLSEQSINGHNNPARPYAILAMSIICVSIGLFFYQFANFLTVRREYQIAIKYGGTLSMISGLFLFSNYHDLVTSISSIFGLIALCGIFLEIRNRDNKNLKRLGAILVFALLINNLIYYSGQYITWLPFIQKVTFIIIFIWIIVYNSKIRDVIQKRNNITNNVG